MQSRGTTACIGATGRYGRLHETGNDHDCTSLFQSTTIPVLRAGGQFAQARHTVLAGNIANLDTPGYQARDLSVDDFQARLKEAIEATRPSGREPRRRASRTPRAGRALAEVAKNSQTHPAPRPEQRAAWNTRSPRWSRTSCSTTLALTIMTSQFRLLQTAISGRV